MPDVADITWDHVADAQQAALMRAQLYGIGETHRIITDFVENSVIRHLNRAKSDPLSIVDAYEARERIADDWQGAFSDWTRMFYALRREAAAVPFGGLAMVHQAYFGQLVKTERKHSWRHEKLAEQRVGVAGYPFFDNQLRVLFDQANQRRIRDKLFSQRIWDLSDMTLAGIQSSIFQAVNDGKHPYEAAKWIEEFLGANAGCPRWTRTRMFGLTKKDIASGDRRGLYTGDACAGQGVSYNALRLMRTEMAYVSNMASLVVMQALPFVERVGIARAPTGVPCDPCDDAVTLGPWPKQEIPPEYMLPVHPNCLPPNTLVVVRGDVTLPIQQLARGHLVRTHEGTWRHVANVMSRHYEGDLVRIVTEAGHLLRATPEHKVRIPDGWKMAEDIRRGDQVIGDYRRVLRGFSLRSMCVLATSTEPYSGPVYDLTIDGPEHSFIANGVGVHNCLCYYVSELPPPDAFLDRLADWVMGRGDWPEMDAYVNWIGIEMAAMDSLRTMMMKPPGEEPSPEKSLELEPEEEIY